MLCRVIALGLVLAALLLAGDTRAPALAQSPGLEAIGACGRHVSGPGTYTFITTTDCTGSYYIAFEPLAQTTFNVTVVFAAGLTGSASLSLLEGAGRDGRRVGSCAIRTSRPIIYRCNGFADDDLGNVQGYLQARTYTLKILRSEGSNITGNITIRDLGGVSYAAIPSTSTYTFPAHPTSVGFTVIPDACGEALVSLPAHVSIVAYGIGEATVCTYSQTANAAYRTFTTTVDATYTFTARITPLSARYNCRNSCPYLAIALLNGHGKSGSSLASESRQSSRSADLTFSVILPPGAYTLRISGVGTARIDATGLALVAPATIPGPPTAGDTRAPALAQSPGLEAIGACGRHVSGPGTYAFITTTDCTGSYYIAFEPLAQTTFNVTVVFAAGLTGSASLSLLEGAGRDGRRVVSCAIRTSRPIIYRCNGFADDDLGNVQGYLQARTYTLKILRSEGSNITGNITIRDLGGVSYAAIPSTSTYVYPFHPTSVGFTVIPDACGEALVSLPAHVSIVAYGIGEATVCTYSQTANAAYRTFTTTVDATYTFTARITPLSARYNCRNSCPYLAIALLNGHGKSGSSLASESRQSSRSADLTFSVILPPGAYTLRISGVGTARIDATGLALVAPATIPGPPTAGDTRAPALAQSPGLEAIGACGRHVSGPGTYAFITTTDCTGSYYIAFEPLAQTTFNVTVVFAAGLTGSASLSLLEGAGRDGRRVVSCAIRTSRPIIYRCNGFADDDLGNVQGYLQARTYTLKILRSEGSNITGNITIRDLGGVSYAAIPSTSTYVYPFHPTSVGFTVIPDACGEALVSLPAHVSIVAYGIGEATVCTYSQTANAAYRTFTTTVDATYTFTARITPLSARYNCRNSCPYLAIALLNGHGKSGSSLASESRQSSRSADLTFSVILPPGAYTLRISGVGTARIDATGLALVAPATIPGPPTAGDTRAPALAQSPGLEAIGACGRHVSGPGTYAFITTTDCTGSYYIAFEPLAQTTFNVTVVFAAGLTGSASLSLLEGAGRDGRRVGSCPIRTSRTIQYRCNGLAGDDFDGVQGYLQARTYTLKILRSEGSNITGNITIRDLGGVSYAAIPSTGTYVYPFHPTFTAGFTLIPDACGEALVSLPAHVSIVAYGIGEQPYAPTHRRPMRPTGHSLRPLTLPTPSPLI